MREPVAGERNENTKARKDESTKDAQRARAALRVAPLRLGMPVLLSWLSVVPLGCALVQRDGPRSGLPEPGHAASASLPEPQRESGPEPFFKVRTQMAEYVGPGRELPPPQELAEVRIGYFGPAEVDHPEGGMMWRAATLAVEEANAAGGYHGLPFRLLSSWSENPWSTGIQGVAKLVYAERVWAIVGAPDGPSAHLVAQVVAKARLTFLSPVSTEKTTNLANVPWVLSCAPDDHVLAPVLAEALTSQAAGRNFALVSCTDHDPRLFTTELMTALTRLKVFPSDHVEFRPGETDFTPHVDRLHAAKPAAVAVIAGPRDSARLLVALRRRGVAAPVFGGPELGRQSFVETAGEYAEGVVFPLLWDPSSGGDMAAAFARRFEVRFGVAPDYTAAYTYDAMNLLFEAIGRAGLNRVRILDALRELSPWTGATGPITWDPTGRNERPVGLGTIRDGRILMVTPVVDR